MHAERPELPRAVALRKVEVVANTASVRRWPSYAQAQYTQVTESDNSNLQNDFNSSPRDLLSKGRHLGARAAESSYENRYALQKRTKRIIQPQQLTKAKG